MNKKLYSKLAWVNIRKNKSTYFPYILSSALIVALFFMLHMISQEIISKEFIGSRTMGELIKFGVYIIAVFSAVFIFYTNSFLLKRRQKELGLYSVLGMEKKHISMVLSFENFYSLMISLIFGIVFGAIFSKLIFAILLNILKLDTSISLNINIKSILLTGALFFIIFILVEIHNRMTINKHSTIDLIKGGEKGEREPRANIFVGILGIISLATGYYIALTIKNVMLVMPSFFIAVLLVIFGTYLLFTSASIIIIKALRKNKNFYYKKDNFIGVSNMLYRMKQNAVGLSNIAILSTAVVLILSSTVSLYIGLEDSIADSFPKEVITNYRYGGQDIKEVQEVISTYAKEYDLKVRNPSEHYNLFLDAYLEKEKLIVNQNVEGESFLSYVERYGKLYSVNIFIVDDYNRSHDKNLKLDRGEVFFHSKDLDFNYKNINIMGKEYKIKDKLDRVDFKSFFVEDLNKIDIVVSDLEELEHLQRVANQAQYKQVQYYVYDIYYDYYFDLDGKMEDKISFNEGLRDTLKERVEGVSNVQDRLTSRQDSLSLYGGLFFIGIFLGTLFMIATVLIIYYKQITEGYEDRDRFRILQQVGMSKSEVKKTIKSQIRLVFFLPLITAIVHVGASFPIVSRFLYLLDLQNTNLFLALTGLVILIFALVYIIVYKWTARVYYKIVN